MVVRGVSHIKYVKKLAEQAKHTSRLRTNVLSGMASAGPPLGIKLKYLLINRYIFNEKLSSKVQC